MEGQKVIGFAARFAHEKGADYLINAIPHILNEFPTSASCSPARTART